MVSSKKSKEDRRKSANLARAKRKGPDWFVIICIAVVVLLAAGIAGFLAYNNHADKVNSTVKSSNVSASNTINDGYTLTKDGVKKAEPYSINQKIEASKYDSKENNVSLYIDYACPHCAEFEEGNIDQLKKWVNDGTIDSVSIHPIAFLSNYSLVAANAMQCVAEYNPDRIWDVSTYLTENHASGWTAKQVYTNIQSELNVNSSDEFTKCVQGGKYDNEVLKATERAQAGPIPNSDIQNIQGTPTVLVNGNQYPGNPDPAAFKQYVEAVVSGQAVPQGNSSSEDESQIGNGN